MDRTVDRWAPLAGVMFVVLVLVGFGIEGSTPSVDDPADEVVAFYADNDVQVKTASAVAAVAGVAVVVFAASLRASLRRHGSAVLASVALAGGVVAAAGIGTDSAIRFGLAESAGDVSPEATQALFALWDGFFWPMHLGMAALIAATSLAALGTRLLPTWLAGLGLLAAVLVVIPVLAVLFAGLIGVVVWTLATSVVVFRRSGTGTAEPT